MSIGICLKCIIRHLPEAEEGGFGNLDHLIPIYMLTLIRGLMIVRMSACLEPYNRSTGIKEWDLVTATAEIV